MKSMIGEKQLAKMDFAGIGLSVACAAYCLLAPVLLSAIPLAGIEFIGHEAVETGMIAAVAVLAGFTFSNGYRIHQRVGHFVFGVIGLAIFLLVRPAVSESLEPFATLFGGTAFVVGHFLNWKWSRGKTCQRT